MDDGPTREAIMAARLLLVASSLPDVIALRQLGLPATSATGLDQLGSADLAETCRQLGWTALPSAPKAWREPVPDEQAGPSQQASTTDSKPALPLVLVMWSPGQFSLAKPALMDPIIAHLRDVHEHLDMWHMNVYEWSPPQAFLDRLQFQMKFHPGGIQPAELLDEIDGTFFDALYDPLPPPKPRPLPSCFSAAALTYRRTLQNVVRGECTPTQLRQAQEDYCAVLEQKLVGPLLEDTASPERQSRQAAMMELSRALHLLAPATEQMLLQLPLIASRETFPDKQLNVIVKLARAVHELSKETDSCSPRLRPAPRPRPAPRRSAGSSTWDSRSRITRP
jgi:hypothetical protein